MPDILVPTLPRLGRVNLARREQEAAAEQGRRLLEAAARRTRVLGAFKARGVTPESVRNKVLMRLRLDAQVQTRALTDRLLRGELSRDAWQRQMRAVLVPAHYAATLAGTGRTDFDPATLAAAQSATRTQIAYLARFRADLATGGTQLDGRALNRADLYGAAVWSTGQAARAEQAKAEGHKEEIGILGSVDHCGSCVDRASQGWQPIGSLLQIGAGLCRSRCGCHISYRGGRDGATLEVTGRRRPTTKRIRSAPVQARSDVAAISPVAPNAKTAQGYGGLAEGVTFSRPEFAQGNNEYQVVLVDVVKFDRSLAGDPLNHVGPGGSGPSGKPGAYTNAKTFIEKARANGTQVDMVRISLDASRPGEADIVDGRHRWAVLRDSGADVVPVIVHRDEVAGIREKFGVDASTKIPSPRKLAGRPDHRGSQAG